MADLMSIETHSGTPIPYKEGKLIPFHQSVCLRIPGLHGGLVWNRPTSVLVIKADGGEQVIPVQDVTRQVVWSLFGITLVMALFFGINSFSKRRKNDD
jgi:hypothetical protein